MKILFRKNLQHWVVKLLLLEEFHPPQEASLKTEALRISFHRKLVIYTSHMLVWTRKENSSLSICSGSWLSVVTRLYIGICLPSLSFAEQLAKLHSLRLTRSASIYLLILPYISLPFTSLALIPELNLHVSVWSEPRKVSSSQSTLLLFQNTSSSGRIQAYCL